VQLTLAPDRLDPSILRPAEADGILPVKREFALVDFPEVLKARKRALGTPPASRRESKKPDREEC